MTAMRLVALALGLAFVVLGFNGCGSSGAGGTPSGGKGGTGGAGGSAAGGVGAQGGTGASCSANQKCSTKDDCFPISCLCPGTTSSVPVDAVCSNGCCLDLKQVCDAFCAKDGGTGGSGGDASVDGGGTGGAPATCDPTEGGTFTLVATDVESDNFVIDADSAYFGSNHSLRKSPLGGGAATDVSAGTWSGHLAIDAANLYVVSIYDVLSIPLTGGSSQSYYTSTTSPPAGGLALDSTNVYFKASSNSHLYKVPIAGGTPVDLAGIGGDSIAVGSTNVYFTSLSDIEYVPIAGGAVQPFSGGGAPDALALDAGFLYYTDWASPTVRRVPLTGGAPVVLATYGGSKGAHTIALDASYVYAATADACSVVVRIPKSGGAAQTIADNQGWVRSVAVDATHVYWLAFSKSSLSGKIWSTLKP